LGRKKIIRKVLVVTAWVAILAGMTTLLVAANRKDRKQVCSKVQVGLKGSVDHFYIDEKDILQGLERQFGKLAGRSVEAIKLSSLEKSLEANQWIRNAELYFDRENVLHISVEEREPIARVFNIYGLSYYMDSSGHKMPLLPNESIRVPVLTNMPASLRNAADTAFLNEAKALAWYVYNHEFWRAQTGQIDVTKDRKFEIIPVVGNHVICLGDGANLEDKFNRLLLFYKKVMSKVGFHKYAVVNVEYAGQIVGVHKGPVSAVDSIQLQKNIEELLQRSTIQNVSEDMLPIAKPKDSIVTMTVAANAVPVKTNPTPVADSAARPAPAKTEKPTVAVPKRTANPNPKKTETRAVVKKPKAVMKPIPTNRH
jgi:cell division protein FtsQ